MAPRSLNMPAAAPLSGRGVAALTWRDGRMKKWPTQFSELLNLTNLNHSDQNISTLDVTLSLREWLYYVMWSINSSSEKNPHRGRDKQFFQWHIVATRGYNSFININSWDCLSQTRKQIPGLWETNLKIMAGSANYYIISTRQRSWELLWAETIWMNRMICVCVRGQECGRIYLSLRALLAVWLIKIMMGKICARCSRRTQSRPKGSTQWIPCRMSREMEYNVMSKI